MRVDSGRLYYCTMNGEFKTVDVPLDAAVRDSVRELTRVVSAAIEKPFLVAAPSARACDYCDYQVVCGPYEEQRTGRKFQEGIAPLVQLRKRA